MKKIEAIIRPEKLSAVKHALEDRGLHAMTIYEVQGRGEQRGLEFTYRAGKFRVDMLPKTKIELVVKDDKLEDAVRAICANARTGEVGDGKIFIIPVERVIKVRTGEIERDGILTMTGSEREVRSIEKEDAASS